MKLRIWEKRQMKRIMQSEWDELDDQDFAERLSEWFGLGSSQITW